MATTIRSLSRSLVLACALAATCVHDTVQTAITYTVVRWRSAWDFVTELAVDFGRWLVSKLPAPARDWSTDFFRVPPSQVGMSKRMARLDRPRVMPRWRMCPST